MDIQLVHRLDISQLLSSTSEIIESLLCAISCHLTRLPKTLEEIINIRNKFAKVEPES